MVGMMSVITVVTIIGIRSPKIIIKLKMMNKLLCIIHIMTKLMQQLQSHHCITLYYYICQKHWIQGIFFTTTHHDPSSCVLPPGIKLSQSSHPSVSPPWMFFICSFNQHVWCVTFFTNTTKLTWILQDHVYPHHHLYHPCHQHHQYLLLFYNCHPHNSYQYIYLSYHSRCHFPDHQI